MNANNGVGNLPILHLMIGLPRSGKSTRARKMGYPIVEPDAIRKVLGCFPMVNHLETLVWSLALIMVRALFAAGHTDVILDAVNHTEERRKVWQCAEWTIQYHVVDISKELCKERAIATDQAYLVPIIERMAQNWEPLGGKVDC